MNSLFLKMVNISWTASLMVLGILLLRLLLRKTPRWSFCILWGLVALRLCLPFSIKSALSLIPSSEPVRRTEMTGRPFSIETGIDGIDVRANDYLESHYFEGVTVETGRFESLLHVLAVMWITGVCIMLFYALLSTLRLRRNLRTATLFEKGIRQSEWVMSPFVFGIFRPVIYLPYHLEDADRAYVIAHEKAHIRRKDHWWKPFGFLLLSVYWFNPLLWLAYVLLCRDIEAACDERVIRDLPEAQLREYSTALLNCSVHRRAIAVCPVAFGETGVKERIKKVMNYRKPAFWIVLLAILACIVVTVCLLTDPINGTEGEAGSDSEVMSNFPYAVAQVTYLDPSSEEVYRAGENTPQFRFFDDPCLSSRPSSSSPWADLGAMEEIALTKHNFDDLFATHGTNGWVLHESASWIRENTVRSWQLVRDKKEFFLLLLQKNGDVYLANGSWDEEEQGDPHSDDTRIKTLFLLAPDSAYAYPVICDIAADIDKDGIIEDVTLSYGPTSGLYTVIVTASVGDRVKYRNTFCTDPAIVGLEVENDGLYALKAERTYGDDGKRTLLTLTVEDGQIVLEAEGSERAAYWGGYEWNKEYREWECDCEVTGIHAVGWTDDPKLRNGSVNHYTLSLGPRHLPVYVFRSQKDVKEFTDRWNGTLNLREVFPDNAKYNEKFFEGRVLMAVYVEAASCSFRYEVSFVQNLYEEITLFATRSNFPEAYDYAMEGWLITVELPREGIVEDTSFDAIQLPGPGGEY